MHRSLSLLLIAVTAAGCANLSEFDATKPVCYETDVITSELTQDGRLVDRNSVLGVLGDKEATASDVRSYWVYSLVGVGLVVTGTAIVGAAAAGGATAAAGAAGAGGVGGGLAAVKQSDNRLVDALTTHNRSVGGGCRTDRLTISNPGSARP